MFHIQLNQFGNPGLPVKHGWKLNERKPLRGEHILTPFENVTIFQATGDELAFIRHHFPTVPMRSDSASVTWRGEMAQFIYDNL